MRGRDFGRGGNQPAKDDKHIINEQITAKAVRLIGSDGSQVGIVKTEDAIRRARSEDLDLVLVAADANPPVCKIVDFGKLKYREQKKAAEARKHSAQHEIKELRVRYSTDSHDLETKIRAAKNFIAEGHKVKFQMRFKGREVAYKELGDQTFNEIIQLLAEDAVVEQRTSLMGNSMSMTFTSKNSVIPGKPVAPSRQKS
ncbi:translation initiation factor IF-3 [bacterium]|nr:translation initiation factor IF-3 [bacterium]